MTFEEAKKKMKEIARGKYHSLSYELTVFDIRRAEHRRGTEEEAECRLYLEGIVHLRHHPKPDLTEQPGEDVGEPKGKEENGE